MESNCPWIQECQFVTIKDVQVDWKTHEGWTHCTGCTPCKEFPEFQKCVLNLLASSKPWDQFANGCCLNVPGDFQQDSWGNATKRVTSENKFFRKQWTSIIQKGKVTHSKFCTCRYLFYSQHFLCCETNRLTYFSTNGNKCFWRVVYTKRTSGLKSSFSLTCPRLCQCFFLLLII